MFLIWEERRGAGGGFIRTADAGGHAQPWKSRWWRRFASRRCAGGGKRRRLRRRLTKIWVAMVVCGCWILLQIPPGVRAQWQSVENSIADLTAGAILLDARPPMAWATESCVAVDAAGALHVWTLYKDGGFRGLRFGSGRRNIVPPFSRLYAAICRLRRNRRSPFTLCCRWMPRRAAMGLRQSPMR